MNEFIDYFVSACLIISVILIISDAVFSKDYNIKFIELLIFFIVVLLIFSKWQVLPIEDNPCTLHDYEYGINLGNDVIYITSFGGDNAADRHYELLWDDSTTTIQDIFLEDNY